MPLTDREFYTSKALPPNGLPENTLTLRKVLLMDEDHNKSKNPVSRGRPTCRRPGDPKLQNLYRETGLVRVPTKDRGLACWLSKQRNLMRHDLIKPHRKEMLLKLGIRPKADRRVTKKNQKNAEKWQSQYAKLEKYHREHGNCNKDDPSLGAWVNTQRSLYKQMKTGESDMDQSGIVQLEELGFEWTVRGSRKKRTHDDISEQN